MKQYLHFETKNDITQKHIKNLLHKSSYKKKKQEKKLLAADKNTVSIDIIIVLIDSCPNLFGYL